MTSPIADVVFIDRFTSFHGEDIFTTPAIDVVRFSSFEIHVWRGITSATFDIAFQTSIDQISWLTVLDGDPGEDSESLFKAEIRGRWLRTVLTLTKVQPSDPEPSVTCWASGILVARLA